MASVSDGTRISILDRKDYDPSDRKRLRVDENPIDSIDMDESIHGAEKPPGEKPIGGKDDKEKEGPERSRRKSTLRFDADYTGQCYVNLECSGDRIIPIKVGKLLRTMGVRFEEIKKTGRNKVKVQMSGYSDANKVLNSTVIATHGFEAYIATESTQRVGVIRGVPTGQDFSDLAIKAELKSQGLKVIDVFRLKRKDKSTSQADGSNALIESESVKLTFWGNRLPSNIKLFGCRFSVTPFVQSVTQCRKCLLFGHLERNCKGTEFRCAKCGVKGHQVSSCPAVETKCLYCNRNHLASDAKACPEFARQKDIKTKMSVCGLSYYEAADINPKQNYYSILEHSDEFVPLPNCDEWHSANVPNKNQTASSSYASVAKGKPKEIRKERQTSTKQVRFPPQQENEFNLHQGPSSPLKENPYKCSGCEKLTTMVTQLQEMLKEVLRNFAVNEAKSVTLAQMVNNWDQDEAMGEPLSF